MKMESHDELLRRLHPSTQVLSVGQATVMGHDVPAILVRNLYGQELVFGQFDCHRGKFKGKRVTNNAATEGVLYRGNEDGYEVSWNPPFGDFE